MTVASPTSRNDYLGTGVTDTYSYTFRIFAATDLLITKVDLAGAETTLAYPADYTVTGVGSFSGGTITLTAGNLTSGHGLTIRFRSTLTQQTDIRNQSGFFPEVVEDALDRLTKLDQQQQDEIDRTIKLPETETGTMTIPALNARRSSFFGFDANGDPIVGAALSSATPATPFAQTLLDDATASAHMDTIFASLAPGAFVEKLRTGLVDEPAPAVNDEVVLRDTSAATGKRMTLANLLKVITLLTAEASPDVADEVALYDASAGTTDKITLADLLKVVNTLTADATPDTAADYLLTYDASDAAAKRVLLSVLLTSSLARNDDSTKFPSTSWVRDHVGEPSDDLTVFKCGSINIPQNVTRYLKAVGTTATATEADAQVYIGMPTEFYGMKIYLSEAVPSGQSIQVRVRKDGVDTTLVTTINGPTSAGAVVNVNAPSRLVFGKTATGTLEKLSVATITSATFGNTNDIAVSLLARVPDSNFKPVSNFALGAIAGGPSNFTGGGEFKSLIFASTVVNTALAHGGFPVPNHVVQRFDQTESTPQPHHTNTAITGNYNYPVDLGSRCTFMLAAPANTAFAGYVVFSDRDCGNDKGTWAPLLFSSVQQAQNTTRYMGGLGDGASATENDVKVALPAGSALRLYARAHAALPAGQSCVITVRKNGVATALTVTLNDANQYATDLINSIAFADNDLMSVSCVSSATAGTLTYQVALELVKNTA